jgi:hypothetical protein
MIPRRTPANPPSPLIRTYIPDQAKAPFTYFVTIDDRRDR